ncbi:MAG: exo-alpha-sialidase, partial [Phycisphaeraceae bacterium]|nr:exo-alpha-sialidase [Phycisphaeraceae bacterium]
PYVDWSSTTLEQPIGGPNLIAGSTGDWGVSGRDYSDGTRTFVARLGRDGRLEDTVFLPSSGDTSYPGLVLEGDRLLVSYYSSHEERTAIYLAEIDLPGSE